MAIIKKKKVPYDISESLMSFLHRHNRHSTISIQYKDLLRYDNSIPLYDLNGEDTLWKTVFYAQADMEMIYHNLKQIYAIMKAGGDMSVLEHVAIDRVDLCTYGNTQPFRVRVVNNINDIFDYFYVKHADASRVYGMQLEDLLSPNRVNYLVYEQTLIEEHIAGIPGDQFIENYLDDKNLNKRRLAKEFVKFNERCFIRLLGDMHSSNFVIVLTPDFDSNAYRIRSIDFDQQSYEGRKAIYMPKYFKQNNPLIQIGLDNLTPETVRQYQKEERALTAYRVRASQKQLMEILHVMKKDQLAPIKNVHTLREELQEYYRDTKFHSCTNMAEILEESLWVLIKGY